MKSAGPQTAPAPMSEAPDLIEGEYCQWPICMKSVASRCGCTHAHCSTILESCGEPPYLLGSLMTHMYLVIECNTMSAPNLAGLRGRWMGRGEGMQMN